MRRRVGFTWFAIAASMILISLSPGISSAAEGYLRFPTISGNDVVFSCEGDLWGVSVEGGTARRLTEGEGAEILPHLSPDGTMIAFTAEYDGNNDVYIIPSEGGEARRLTYHPYGDQVIGWSPDGAYVIFRSIRQSAQPVYKAFKVPAGGGAAEALPLDKVGTLSFAPDGHRVAFTRTATEFRTWKRYKGGTAQDVWVGDLDKMEFAKITDYVGTDGYPLWVEDRIYFVSDRDGVMNIYSTDTAGGNLRQHTHHTDYDVRWPSYATGRIVYECGGDLWILEVASGRDYKMRIDLRSDRVEMRPRYVEPAKYVTDFRLSPEGLRAAFCSRGDLEIVPTKEGRLIEIAAGSAQREKFPRWTNDGKKLVYVSDGTGEEEIYMVDAERKNAPKQITKNTNIWKFAAVPSPDGKKIAYADATFRLFVIDMETGWRVAVDSSSVWEIDQYAWSPDSKWLAYAKPEDYRFSSIFIYDTAKSKITRVTDRFTNDTAPTWDPEGKYLYFFSDRTLNPFLSKRGFEMILEKMTKPYLVMLRAGEKSPFFPKEPAEQEQQEQGEEDKGEEGKAAEKGKGPAEIVIDLDGITDRVVEFPVGAGDMAGLGAVKDKIFYLMAPPMGLAEGGRGGEEENPIYDLHVYKLKDKEDKVIEEGIDGYDLAADGKNLLLKRREAFWTIKSDKTSKSDEDENKTTVDLSRWHLRVEPAQEFKQMFEESWRLQRDFYWAPNMAGTDWPAMRAKYETLLPRIATRADLNDLMGNLIGELSTSHTYIWGGDIKRPKGVPVGLLGADVAADRGSGFYKITKIYPTEPSSPEDVSPLTLSHAGAKPGDYIVAVNGKPIRAPDDFYSAFVNLANEEVLLSINSEPKMDGARDVIVKTVASDTPVRYLDWVRTRRQYVDKATAGKCGYFHIPDTGSSGLVEFSRTFFPQMEKPAMIIDVRHNGGGSFSEIIIERVGRELLAMGQAGRRGVPYRYPEDAVYAHRVLLTNEEAGSDGDVFTRAFKLANLGPSVGMRTWGGVVGFGAYRPFVDGGMMTIPEFAWYEGEGWTLENRGAEPDVVIDNLPGDEAAGIDRQLDKAIEMIKADLERDPMKLPPLPPYPNKTLK